MPIEKLLELKHAMRRKEAKEIVKQKFMEYTLAYDEGERDVGDKLRHREIFMTYSQYMAGSGNE